MFHTSLIARSYHGRLKPVGRPAVPPMRAYYSFRELNVTALQSTGILQFRLLIILARSFISFILHVNACSKTGLTSEIWDVIPVCEQVNCVILNSIILQSIVALQF